MTRSSFRPQSIAEVADRVSSKVQPFDFAVREFLDSWQTLPRSERSKALAIEPRPVGKVEDAYLGALAEYLASVDRIDAPDWADDPRRFLEEPFFAGGLQSLKGILLVESPSAFRRRLLFISANALSRPRRDVA